MNWGITCFFENKKDFEIVAKIAPDYPLKFIEIRGERPFFSPDDLIESDLKFFSGIIQSAQLKVTLHATFYDINLSTINTSLRKATLECYRAYLDLGQAIGAEIMVVHGGHLHHDAVNVEKLLGIARQNLIENLVELGEYARGKGIRIGLENSPPNPNRLMVYDWQSQIAILEAVNHPNVGAVLDVAHAFLQRLDIFEYYRYIEDYLVEIHAHNNNGEKDLHRGINLGEINYKKFFSVNSVKVPVIMEIRDLEEAMESLEWIKRFENS